MRANLQNSKRYDTKGLAHGLRESLSTKHGRIVQRRLVCVVVASVSPSLHSSYEGHQLIKL